MGDADRTAEDVIAALEAAPVEQRAVWGGRSRNHAVVPIGTVMEAVALLREAQADVDAAARLRTLNGILPPIESVRRARELVAQTGLVGHVLAQVESAVILAAAAVGSVDSEGEPDASLDHNDLGTDSMSGIRYCTLCGEDAPCPTVRERAARPDRCPTCGSDDPDRRPHVQEDQSSGGPCWHPWHFPDPDRGT